MKVGESWGHLRVKAIRAEPIKAEGPRGSYPTGEFEPQIYTLQCDCGREVEMSEVDFPGKRIMRSCLYPGCNFAQKSELGRPRTYQSGDTQIVTMYAPKTIVKDLEEYAKGAGLTRSRAATVAVEAGLKTLNRKPRKGSKS